MRLSHNQICYILGCVSDCQVRSDTVYDFKCDLRPDVEEDVGVVFRQGKKCQMNTDSQGSEKDNNWPVMGGF